MNVRLTAHQYPLRTVLYGGVQRIESDGVLLLLYGLDGGHKDLPVVIQQATIAQIELDDEPGDFW